MSHVDVDSPFRWTKRSWGRALECTALAEVAEHLFSTRDLDLAPAGGWELLAGAVGVEPHALRRLRQVHGNRVVRAEASPAHADPADSRPEADAIVTATAGVALAVQVADCVPVLLADSSHGIVGAAHAGWRGIRSGVVGRTVERMAELGSDPADIIAAVGPSIGACCYEVGADVLARFREAGHPQAAIGRWFIAGAGGRFRLDLWRATRDQLAAAGLLAGRIHVAGLCTATHRQLFCSYRVDGPGAGRCAGLIRARPAPPPRPSPGWPADRLPR